MDKQFRQKLKGVRAMKTLVRGIEQEMQEIRPQTLKDSVRGSSADFPYTQHTVVIEGETELEKNPEYRKLRRNLEANRKQWLEEIQEVEQVLKDLEPEQQDILRRYYINGQSMEEIGNDLGYAKSAIHKKIKSYFVKE